MTTSLSGDLENGGAALLDHQLLEAESYLLIFRVPIGRNNLRHSDILSTRQVFTSGRNGPDGGKGAAVPLGTSKHGTIVLGEDIGAEKAQTIEAAAMGSSRYESLLLDIFS